MELERKKQVQRMNEEEMHKLLEEKDRRKKVVEA